jgi:hypothetical protein
MTVATKAEIVSLIFGLALGACIGIPMRDYQWHKKMIGKNYAHYNSTNGNWEWNVVSTNK